MERFFTEDQQIKKQFEGMKAQVRFLEELGKTSPKPELITFIQTHKGSFKETLKKYEWTKWSSTSQWALQLAIVGLLLVVTVHLFPWLNLARSIKGIKQLAPQLKSVKFQEPEVVRTLYGPIWPADLPSPDAYALKIAEEKTKNAAIAEIVVQADEESNSQASEDNEAAVPVDGFLWRGVLRVESLDSDITNKITQDMATLGAQKAGQVELGWQKGDSRYYHFTMPIENYTAFQEKMSEFGKLTLQKEKHPRVMKDGIMRVIMSVEVEK